MATLMNASLASLMDADSDRSTPKTQRSLYRGCALGSVQWQHLNCNYNIVEIHATLSLVGEGGTTIFKCFITQP